MELDCHDARIVQYYEVTNLAIQSAINVPYGRHVTPRTRLLESISLILDRLSEEDRELKKETIGWELGESLVLLPPVPSVEEILNNDLVKKMMCAGISEDHVAFFIQRQCTAYPCRPRCPPKGENRHPRLERPTRS